MQKDQSSQLAFKWASKHLLNRPALRKLHDSYEKYSIYTELRAIGVVERGDEDEEDVENIVEKIKQHSELYADLCWKDSIAGKNIALLGQKAGLNNAEMEVLTFLVMYQQSTLLKFVGCRFGNVNKNMFYHAIASMLDIDEKAVQSALSATGRLLKTSLIRIYSAKMPLEEKYDFTHNFDEVVCDAFLPLNSLITLFIRPVEDVSLQLEDYSHIAHELDYIVPYLKTAMASRAKGCNVLLYGPPGTGKTELVKTLARELNASLYEVKTQDHNHQPLEPSSRLASYNAGCHLLEPNGKHLILFDELEDVVPRNDIFGDSKSDRSKVWFNRLLENNSIPTLWTSNQAEGIDGAYIRRFDIVLEMTAPNKIQRVKLFKNACDNGYFQDEWIENITESVTLAPAEGKRIAKVIHMAASAEKSQVHAAQLIKHSYKAVTGISPQLEKPCSKIAAIEYKLEWLNTQCDIANLFSALSNSQTGRLCLYGPPGCGKTQFAHYLAQQTQMPIISKKASDLISAYVGETEKRIAQAFAEATAEKSVLLIDEADSFFMNRHSLRESWEVTRVNELLVQLEQFNGLFIASTNLMDNFDHASKRRFDFKVEFDYLTSKQTFDLYCCTLHEKPFPDALEKLMLMKNLTPGNFAVAKRQALLLQQPITNWFLMNILAQEAANNPVKHKNSPIGFIH